MAKISARLMQLPDDVVPLYERDMARLSSDSIKRIYNEVLNFYLPEIEPDHGAKMLVTCGDKEARAIINNLANIVEQVPTITTAIAPNAHHGWNGEHPELFSEMILRWIQQRSLADDLEVQHSGRQLLAEQG